MKGGDEDVNIVEKIGKNLGSEGQWLTRLFLQMFKFNGVEYVFNSNGVNLTTVIGVIIASEFSVD